MTVAARAAMVALVAAERGVVKRRRCWQTGRTFAVERGGKRH